ncbi:MlaD family protein [Gordonia neofelifaecis]|uniref:Mammalian cell entry related domain-containing protein n=1 Tax=Gordonia neofelifaecis NRRL B-59395 TaxID=644548 RepID=F1YHQ1_9ACTN|nr:MlaD family protein [Gordonia neofelifaecis]EGD55889.1 mammalian cell entry related domain-containing protein [Gordonia neofelifaecis NRRL B-59395]
MTRIKKAGVAAVALLTTVSLAACGVVPGITVEQIPLPAPGGIGDSITVHTSFENALNLPNKAKVRLGGMDVGEVESIVAKNYRAEVTMNVAKDTQLPVGTGAELRQATPLGDVFVALQPPADASKGYVQDGGTLTGPISAAATVEDLLVSMTGLVDSGSISSLQRIFTELSTAVGGNAPELHGAIEGFTTAIDKFNKNSAAVDEAMATTAVWSKELANGRTQIAAAINKLPAAINTINDQLGMILTTLDKSNKVTSATNDFLNSEQDAFAEMLGHLNTTLVALDKSAPIFGPLADRLAELNPKWVKSTSGSAAAVSAKVYWLSPGVGFDAASRLPEGGDITNGMHSMEQTLARIIARLTGTKGCCS